MSEELELSEKHKIIGQILSKYPVMDDLTQEQQSVWDEWLSKVENKKFFESIITDREADLQRFLKIKEGTPEAKEEFYARLGRSSTVRIGWPNKWKTFVAAASIIILAGTLFLVWSNSRKTVTNAIANTDTVAQDSPPGKFQAKLTLDDGTVVILDTAANGQLAKEGNVAIINKDGQLLYDASGSSSSADIRYNTLSTSRGESYATRLSDGTKVWLNSQSSIRYPVSFSGDVRQVEITGEAYFEVAPSIVGQVEKMKQPFVVNGPGLKVEVLGTHFNINAYGDEEAVRTTLLEGKVKLLSQSNESTALLQPGQQAVFKKDHDKGITVIKDADVEQAVAWHKGYFQFNGADVQTVLRQLSRWYDVDVMYQGIIPKRSFDGKIVRRNSLSQVLTILESNDVHFRIEGKKIIVYP